VNRRNNALLSNSSLEKTSRPLKFTTDFNSSMGKRVSHGPVSLSGVSASERAERQFADNAVIQTVREWIRRQPQAFFEKGIRMLPERWEKCVDSGGEKVED
jgi:hypothetical protein